MVSEMAVALQKDHPDIAQYGDDEGPLQAWRMCIASVAMVFRESDPNFDTTEFIRACMPCFNESAS